MTTKLSVRAARFAKFTGLGDCAARRGGRSEDENEDERERLHQRHQGLERERTGGEHTLEIDVWARATATGSLWEIQTPGVGDRHRTGSESGGRVGTLTQ
jgi:hypothetical protein